MNRHNWLCISHLFSEGMLIRNYTSWRLLGRFYSIVYKDSALLGSGKHTTVEGIGLVCLTLWRDRDYDTTYEYWVLRELLGRF